MIRQARFEWPDIARGACVILVVLHHVIRQMVDQAPASWESAGSVWSLVDAVLTPIRIPLFFFISALLIRESLFRPWQEARKRVIVPAYLYVLWTALLTIRLLVPGAEQAHGFLGNLVGNWLLAGSGYWYLYALPLYFLYSRATRNWPVWLAVGILLPGLFLRLPITSWTQEAGYTVMDSASLLGSVLANGAFYVLGARYGGRLLGARRLGSLPFIVGVSGYVLLEGVGIYFGIADLLMPIASIFGIGLGVGLAQRTSANGRVGRALKFVGQRTLPIYVLQFFFISVLSFLWPRVSAAGLPGLAPWVAWIYPLVLTGLAVGLSLLFYSWAIRTQYLSWLFAPPASWVRAKP